ncbi:MAG: hypothetical protein COA57_12855 [Flavobacteriales bacterium]|nr:MAG: hypothetical protein COA57_12855 [Flavobacteriales bacterium]
MKRIWFTYLVSIFLVNGIAQDSTSAFSFSLKEALDYAVKNSYQSQTAALDIEVSEQTVKSVTAIGYPQINATGSFQNYIDLPIFVVPSDAFGFPDWFNEWINSVSQSTQTYPNIPAGNGSEFQELQFGSKYNSSGSITVNQLIFDGSYFIGLKAAKIFVEVTQHSLTKTETEVKMLVTQSYYTALVSEENINILSENNKTLEKTLAETKAMYEAGFVEEMDVEQLKLMLANVENSFKTAQQQSEISRSLLKFQMGLDIAQKIELKDDISSLLGATEVALVTQDFKIENHIDFKLVATNETLMELNTKAEKMKYIPRLSGFFNHQQNSYRNEFDFFSGGKWYPTTLWGINLSVPLFGGFGRQANLQKAKLELEKAQIQKEMVEQNLKLQEQVSRAEYNTAMDVYKNQKENLALADKIRNKTAIKFREGVASSMELTQAENQYLTTQGNYIQSVFQLLNAKTKLDKALNNI